jgi:hypothetical protein
LEVTTLATTVAAAAEKLRDEILQKLDDVCGAVYDSPDLSDEQIELLKLLPADELELIAAWAEEYAENVRDYALLARRALQAKSSKAGPDAGMPLAGGHRHRR